MKDFIFDTYEKLLQIIIKNNYNIIPFQKISEAQGPKILILRHDIDRNPENALKIALIENKLNIKSTYYFRIVKQSNQPDIIKKIVDLGHEIGYHYEDISLTKGNFEAAIESFKNNLDYFRKYYPVNTICMHGSPLSKWDNRILWGKYNYRDFGIIGEPYFDVNFDQYYYYTDTGRCWNGEKFSIRDKVVQNSNLAIKTTFDFIRAFNNDETASRIIITMHPHLWSDNFHNWVKIFILQNTKNMIKRVMVLKARVS